MEQGEEAGTWAVRGGEGGNARAIFKHSKGRGTALKLITENGPFP